jgi:hypothetical protein
MDDAALELRIAAAVTAALEAAAGAAQPPPLVNAVGVKIPQFWPKDVHMWFRRVEASFGVAKITRSYTKFEHVVSQLPEDVMISIRSVLDEVTPDTLDAFEQVKEALCTSYGRTRWQCGYSIIDHPELGDRRPSRMMSEMIALLPAGVAPDLLFFCLFLRRLPASLRDHVAAADHKTAATMAAHADLLWDARSGSTVAAIADSLAAAAPYWIVPSFLRGPAAALWSAASLIRDAHVSPRRRRLRLRPRRVSLPGRLQSGQEEAVGVSPCRRLRLRRRRLIVIAHSNNVCPFLVICEMRTIFIVTARAVTYTIGLS